MGDQVCGKRLKAALPSMVESLERHGHLDLDPGVRRRLFSASAATIDKLLRPIREQAGSRRKRKQKRKMAGRIPVGTFSDWKEPESGYLEIDLVAHCGGTVTGSYISSLVVTDVYSGWTEAIPLLAREQSLAVEGLSRLPSSDPRHKLRQRQRVHQRDFGSVTARNETSSSPARGRIGRTIKRGLSRRTARSCAAASATSATPDRWQVRRWRNLYGAMRLYVNHFQPSFQLLERSREGGTVKKRYGIPATPCDRLMWRDDVSEETKVMLRDSRSELDPVSLLHTIREAQSALPTINETDSASAPQSGSLERFLSSLPDLWHQGEVRPTHAPRKRKRRGIRTRPDPFAGVWCEILDWLQQHPDAKAAELLDRLMARYPGRYSRRQLRTLQRRVRQWRIVVAKQLVYASAEQTEMNEANRGDINL